MHASNQSASARSVRARIGLLAAAAGITVANLYYAQPLAPMIGKSLNASDRVMGIALTFTQVGYAVGMLFLVPLGDARERRRLLMLMAAAAVPTLLLVSAARNVVALTVFNVALVALGVTSSLPQLAVPFAVTLVPVEDRGGHVATGPSAATTGALVVMASGVALATHVAARAAPAAASRPGRRSRVCVPQRALVHAGILSGEPRAWFAGGRGVRHLRSRWCHCRPTGWTSLASNCTACH